jgi:hypothetical protein
MRNTSTYTPFDKKNNLKKDMKEIHLKNVLQTNVRIIMHIHSSTST